MSDLITNLTPLKCRSCGDAVPLGEGGDTRCPTCGAETSIPAVYLELRALRTRDLAQRRAADALLKKLDRPAWLLTKILARVFDQPMIAFWILYAAPIIFLSFIAALTATKYWARHLGFRSGADVPSWEVYLLASAFVFVLVSVPRVVGIYADRRAAGRIRLLAGLQARAPSTPGGPALCRICGAPLEVARNALVAHCLYCETDNAIEVRTPLRDATRHAVSEVGHALRDAVSLDRKERRALLRTLLSELKRYSLRALGFAVPVCIWGWDYDRYEKTGETPGWGLFSLIFLTFYLIIMMLNSGGRKKPAWAPDRLSGNDVPEWVGWAGPLLFWAVVYTGLRLFSLR